MANIENLKSACILVVDDEQPNVILIEKILELDGYTNVISTSDPKHGLMLYDEFKPSLVLLDINMPEIDGFAFLEKLSEQEADESFPSVVMLTAQTDRESRIRALNNGARDYVHKPFDRIELLSRIKIQLEVKLLHETVRNQNKILEQKVQERTRELNDTRLEVINRLGVAAEYKDNETGLHIIRMSQISMKIAQQLGLPDSECDLILNASPMHDIGKIGIPDCILQKPGKLDAEEWEIMQTHTTIGSEILSGSSSDLLCMADIIALTHHEKWDGTGYPNGLSGEDIPLVGRIVALADVFDALTSERPYKKPWPVQEAVDYIHDMSGKQFDPEIVEAFDTILHEVVKVTEKYNEVAQAPANQDTSTQTIQNAG